MSVSDIIENTGHGAKGIGGLEYQFLYFVDRLLRMTEKGEIVSYEKYDDVSKISGETVTYYQLKHTIESTESHPVNLVLRDSDLWKTISVWVDVAKHQNEVCQKEFVEENKFVLVTNKVVEKNEFWIELQKLQKNKVSYTEFKDFCNRILKGCKDTTQKDGVTKESCTKKYIRSLLEFEYAEPLLRSIAICLESDIKANILDSLENNKCIPSKNVECAYNELLGAIKNKYITQSIDSYSREDFSKFFRRICGKYRERKFCFKRGTLLGFPEHPETQIFIRQLIDIDDLQECDIELIADYTREKVDYINNIGEALRNDDVSLEEITETRDDVVRFWRQKFNYHMKRVNVEDEDEVKEKAADLLDDVRSKDFDFIEGKLDMYFSNGCIYYLSDRDDEHEPMIGWRPGWEDKYKRNG